MYVVTVSCTTKGKHAKALALKLGYFLKDKAVMSQGTAGYKVAFHERDEQHLPPPPPAGADVYLVVKPYSDEKWADKNEVEKEL